VDNHTKRFRNGRQRSLFLLDQDVENDNEQDDQQDDEGEDVQSPDGAGESDWDSLAFEQCKSFAPCTTPYCKDRNIAHTHSTDRCYKLHPPKGKGAGGKGSSSLLFTKGKRKMRKVQARAKEKTKESLARAKVIGKAKDRREGYSWPRSIF
jgi:hypothetical protein